MLNTIEKVLLLQEVEIFESVTTENLGQIAVVTEVVEFGDGEVIYSEGDSATAMYVVVSGQVRLHRGDEEVMIAGPKSAFGVWALFEEEERVVTATCLADTRLLRLEKQDFYDLLADHTDITKSVLQSMSRRLRSLVGRVSHPRGAAGS
jgi:CRP-like cAMP-binding protein